MKTYVIRKYVKAKSALDAIKKEKKKERERNQEKDRSPFERDPWGRW